MPPCPAHTGAPVAALRGRITEDMRRIALLRSIPGTAQAVDRCLRRVQVTACYVASNYERVI